jgi:cofilin
MPRSGVKLDDTSLAAFEALKTKKESRFILFAIDFTSRRAMMPISVVEKVAPAGTSEEDWAIFSGKLADNYATKCCYAVFDWENVVVDTSRSCDSARMIMFVLWFPKGAKVKDKMMHMSTKIAFTKPLIGLHRQHFHVTPGVGQETSSLDECKEKAKSVVSHRMGPSGRVSVTHQDGSPDPTMTFVLSGIDADAAPNAEEGVPPLEATEPAAQGGGGYPAGWLAAFAGMSLAEIRAAAAGVTVTGGAAPPPH